MARTTTLTLSTAPHTAISPNATQNHTASGAGKILPRPAWFASPNKMVPTPKIATHTSIVRPAFCNGGRCAMKNTQAMAPTGIAARRMPRPMPSAPLCSGMICSAKMGSSVTAPPSSTANISSVSVPRMILF